MDGACDELDAVAVAVAVVVEPPAAGAMEAVPLVTAEPLVCPADAVTLAAVLVDTVVVWAASETLPALLTVTVSAPPVVPLELPQPESSSTAMAETISTATCE